MRRVERDAAGSLYAPGQADERIRYRIATYLHRWREEDLRRVNRYNGTIITPQDILAVMLEGRRA